MSSKKAMTIAFVACVAVMGIRDLEGNSMSVSLGSQGQMLKQRRGYDVGDPFCKMAYCFWLVKSCPKANKFPCQRFCAGYDFNNGVPDNLGLLWQMQNNSARGYENWELQDEHTVTLDKDNFEVYNYLFQGKTVTTRCGATEDKDTLCVEDYGPFTYTSKNFNEEVYTRCLRFGDNPRPTSQPKVQKCLCSLLQNTDTQQAYLATIEWKVSKHGHYVTGMSKKPVKKGFIQWMNDRMTAVKDVAGTTYKYFGLHDGKTDAEIRRMKWLSPKHK
jgi:hypothetical protein